MCIPTCIHLSIHPSIHPSIYIHPRFLLPLLREATRHRAKRVRSSIVFSCGKNESFPRKFQHPFVSRRTSIVPRVRISVFRNVFRSRFGRDETMSLWRVVLSSRIKWFWKEDFWKVAVWSARYGLVVYIRNSERKLSFSYRERNTRHLVSYLLLSTYGRQRSLATLEERGKYGRHSQSSFFARVRDTSKRAKERKESRCENKLHDKILKDEERGRVSLSLVSLVSIYIYVYIYIASLIT